MINSIFFAQNGPHYSLGTKLGTPSQTKILGTGGLNIKGYRDVDTYGMQHKLESSGSWTTTVIGSTLTNDYFDVSSFPGFNLSEDTSYHYRSFIIVDSVYYYGDTLLITTLVTPYFNVSPSTIYIPQIGGTSTIEVDTNLTWDSGSSSPSWITYFPKYGTGIQTINVSISTQGDRSGAIFFTAPDFNISVTIAQGNV